MKTTDIKNTIKSWNERITWDEYFMNIALIASSRSPCKRLNVGCVLVKDKRVISMGYNGFLTKCVHKSIIRDDHEQATVHAEQNAISDAAKRGVSLNDCVAYITHYPCLNCTKLLYSSGIKDIIYLDEYKNDKIINEIFKDNINIKKILKKILKEH